MAYDTSVLDQAIEDRRAAWERQRQEKLRAVLDALDSIAPQYGVDEAYVFGSLTRPGSYHADSDIDIAIGNYTEGHFFDLAGQLSRLLGQDIDILPIDKIHFAAKIKREGVRWTPPNGYSGNQATVSL